MYKIPKILIYIVLALTLNSCINTALLMLNKDYDTLISYNVKRLSKNKGKTEKLIEDTKAAYYAALAMDMNTIEELKRSGEPDIWENIYFKYELLHLRDSSIQSLPEHIYNQINPIFPDYSAEIKNAKIKAAGYLYAKGMSYFNVENIDKNTARLAHNLFMRCYNLFPSYKDVYQKALEAHRLGMVNISLEIFNNEYWNRLPTNAMLLFTRFNTEDINNEWVSFYGPLSFIPDDVIIDYILEIQINNISSPFPEVKYRKDEYVEWKNLKTRIKINDSTYKTVEHKVECLVREVDAICTAELNCQLNLINLHANDIVYTKYLKSSFYMSHKWAVISGDRRAIENDLRLINLTRETPYIEIPPPERILYSLSIDMIQKIRGFIGYQKKQLRLEKK